MKEEQIATIKAGSVLEEDVDIDNLLLNMSSGLLPEHLRKDEINLLDKKYGKNWFTKLGYTEPDYKKPVKSK